MHIDGPFESKISHPDNGSIFTWCPINPLYEDPAKVANVPDYIHVAGLLSPTVQCQLRGPEEEERAKLCTHNGLIPLSSGVLSTACSYIMFNLWGHAGRKTHFSARFWGSQISESETHDGSSSIPQPCRNKHIFLGFNWRVTWSYRRPLTSDVATPPSPRLCICSKTNSKLRSFSTATGQNGTAPPPTHPTSTPWPLQAPSLTHHCRF